MKMERQTLPHMPCYSSRHYAPLPDHGVPCRICSGRRLQTARSNHAHGAPCYLIRDRDGTYGCYRHALVTSHGHPRQAHCARLTVAELLCLEANRVHPSRMRRPCRRIGRTAFAPSPKILCELLQYRDNAPLIGQGCASLAPRPAGRTHRVACLGRRSASPIRPNLSFRHTQVQRIGRITSHALLGGLHHHYMRD
jgi:hypothetical protein